MGNQYTESRDAFAVNNPEAREVINNREWGVVRAGNSGSTLILLPGTLGRADIFWQQIEALRNRVNIVALSYPDGGSIEDWVEDIVSLMDRDGIETACVLGSSLGGYIAQYLAEKHPSRVSTLVAANTLNSVAIISNFPPYSLDLDTVPIEDIRSGFTQSMQRTLEANPESRELVELLLGEVEGRISDSELRMRLKALKHGPELAAEYSEHCPTYTVESDDDQLIPEPIRIFVRERLKPKRAFRFKIGSHFPYVVRPQAYLALLEEALGLKNTGEAWTEGAMSEQ